MILRPYQREAVEAVYRHLRVRDDNPCVVIPTGGGKTPIIASIVRDTVERWNGRVLVLTHVRELLEQTVERITQTMAGGAALPSVGVYSAGASRRDLGYPATVATIQSVWRKADAIGKVDQVLIDEAHMIPTDGDGGEGMYRSFLYDAITLNPRLRVVGFTATPWRLRGGPICRPKGDTSGAVLNQVCYEVRVDDLTRQGYLSPIIIERGPRAAQIRFDDLKVRGGEFVASDVDRVMGDAQSVVSCVSDLFERTAPGGSRKSTLIFAASVEHARRIVEVFSTRFGVECGMVSAKTHEAERAKTLRRFDAGELKYLANVAVLTTGYDAPRIDCIALMRPTMSPGLYAQMVGRGLRLSPETGKRDCLVIDYGGNAVRHGLIDDIRPDRGDDPLPAARECPACATIVPTASAACPRCGKALPAIARPRRADEPAWGLVDSVAYAVHTRRDGAPGYPTMRVEYRLASVAGDRGPGVIREWLCFEHPRGGFARRKAEDWWVKRSKTPIPQSVDLAVRLAEAGALAEPRSITWSRPKGERYDRIDSYELPARPEPVTPAMLRAHEADIEDREWDSDTLNGLPV